MASLIRFLAISEQGTIQPDPIVVNMEHVELFSVFKSAGAYMCAFTLPGRAELVRVLFGPDDLNKAGIDARLEQLAQLVERGKSHLSAPLWVV